MPQEIKNYNENLFVSKYSFIFVPNYRWSNKEHYAVFISIINQSLQLSTPIMRHSFIATFILSSLVTISASAEDFGGKLYVDDATITPGGTTVLSVQLDGISDVSGFQFQMNLPMGIAY